MRLPRLHSRIAVAAIGLLLAGLMPGSPVTATNLKPAATGSTQPAVLYTDIASGPITGGENNKGIYLSIFGKNFGTSAGMGVSTRVFVGGVEVDNYRYLGTSDVSGASGIQRITVQLGSLGSPTLGTALPIDVKVNGVDSNTDIQFTPNPGNIYFVSNLSGNNATGVANDINHPYRNVQLPGIGNNGVSGCPISAGNQSATTAGVWGLVRPGDFIVMRGGTWTDLARDDFFLRAQNKSGTAPTGASDSGPISVIGYPTEDVFINMDHNANALVEGGISSADGARQALGCGSWITVADLRLESGGREGMITTQAGYANPAGSHWRVVNNELTAATANNNSVAKGAGVSGSGIGEIYYGNYIHDVYGGNPNAHENHGFYIDGSGSYDIAYNWIRNIVGGNGINVYGSSGTDPDNIRFHHNVVNGVGKHGLNIADGSTHDLYFYDNLVYNIADYCVRFNTDSLSGSGAKVWGNTFYNCGTVRDDFGYDAVVVNTWGDLPPSLSSLYDNILVSSTTGPTYFGGSSIGAIDSNLYYGTSDTDTYSSDPHAVVANPLFTSTTPGSENFALQAGSHAVNAGTALVSSLLQSTRDLSLDVTRPQGGVYDIGAYELSDSATPPPTPTTFHPIKPVRLLDTRHNNGLSGPLQANTPACFQIAGRDVIPAGATAVTGNLTVTDETEMWAVYLGPDPIAYPSTSTLNFRKGDVTPNGVTVALGTGSPGSGPAGYLCATYMSGQGNTTALVFDATGFFTPDNTGATYHPVTPVRLLDTRNGNGLSAPLHANTPACFSVAGRGGVPVGATAVTGNLTVTDETDMWAIYLGPDPMASPTTSTLNFVRGDIKPNNVTVALGTGAPGSGPAGYLCATYMSQPGNTTSLVFDVTGFFTADLTGARFVPVTPVRLLDTRSSNGLSAPLQANTPACFSVARRGGVPVGATAVTGNLTVTDETDMWAIALGPDPIAHPTTSTLNFVRGDIRANGVAVKLGTGVSGSGPAGHLCATYMSSPGNTTSLVFDVTGYFVP
ncbi:MAG TPA: right-handed parallel beta-helix repeat-containing protein [Candidatus Limnocylindrales bacterium]